MRAWQVFASMTPEQNSRLMGSLAEKAPGAYAQALAAAGAAMKARPVFLMRQPPEKRAEAVRRALARVRASDIAEEMLAVYFIDCRKELLVEWLDALGLEHEEGILTASSPEPPATDKLKSAVESFRQGEEASDTSDRELLLSAFAAQSAIEWPELDALIPVKA